MDKKALLAEIQREREALDSELSKLSETQMGEMALYDQWTPRDLLAHLGFWEMRAAELVQTLTRGEEPMSVGPGEGIDELNAKAFQDNHNLPLVQVKRAEHSAYLALIDLVEKTSEKDLTDPARFTWLLGNPLSQVVADNTFGHYAEHLPHLKAWMEQRAK